MLHLLVESTLSGFKYKGCDFEIKIYYNGAKKYKISLLIYDDYDKKLPAKFQEGLNNLGFDANYAILISENMVYNKILEICNFLK